MIRSQIIGPQSPVTVIKLIRCYRLFWHKHVELVQGREELLGPWSTRVFSDTVFFGRDQNVTTRLGLEKLKLNIRCKLTFPHTFYFSSNLMPVLRFDLACCACALATLRSSSREVALHGPC